MTVTFEGGDAYVDKKIRRQQWSCLATRTLFLLALGGYTTVVVTLPVVAIATGPTEYIRVSVSNLY